jgi:hypothetical protein
MKQYHSIPYYNQVPFGINCYAFDKLDGSNVRFEFSKKRGWYKFGTRTQMISESDPNFGLAIPLFLEKYGDDLESVFRKKYSNIESFVVFGEFFGENSFAGQHVTSDKKDIVIFDINLYKRGFIKPDEFLDNFGHTDIPELVYKGVYDLELIHEIRNSNLKEGVICKGVRKTKGDELIWMTKIKTNEWLQKVKALYGERALLEELNKDISLIL